MFRQFTKMTLAGALGLIAVVLVGDANSRADDKKDAKVPTIAEIMKANHLAGKGNVGKLKDAVKAQKWDDARKYAAEFANLAESLGKNEPPKGDGESWEKLTKRYAEVATLVQMKLKGEEKYPKVEEITQVLNKVNCAECHKVHKRK